MSNKKPKRLKKENNKIKVIITLISFIIFICCILYLIYSQYSKNKDKENIKEIQEYKNVSTEEISNEEIPIKTDMMVKVEELQKINTDVKGWIKIENTIIDYPILQGTDNSYYLTHNYKKEENKYGSIFVKDKCNFNDVNSNLIIYGHNMKDDEMFNSLLKYENKKFYDEHKIINITTESEERKYEIVAVMKSRVFYKDEKNVFRYYNYLNFENENKYAEYINNVKKEQLYETGINANYGEQLITLITCEYSQENGRMVVVAKKI